LVLAAPITYRPSRGREEQEYPASGVSVAAHRIVSLFVTYVEQITPPSQVEAEAEEEGRPSTVGTTALTSDRPVHPSLSGPSPDRESPASAPAAPPDVPLG
jgi:hypothetical protein